MGFNKGSSLSIKMKIASMDSKFRRCSFDVIFDKLHFFLIWNITILHDYPGPFLWRALKHCTWNQNVWKNIIKYRHCWHYIFGFVGYIKSQTFIDFVNPRWSMVDIHKQTCRICLFVRQPFHNVVFSLHLFICFQTH